MQLFIMAGLHKLREVVTLFRPSQGRHSKVDLETRLCYRPSYADEQESVNLSTT